MSRTPQRPTWIVRPPPLGSTRSRAWTCGPCWSTGLDQVPVAFVVAGDQALGVDSVRASCRALLADFKVPHEVYVVPALPRSVLNKVSKARLREVSEQDADRPSAAQRWGEQISELEVSE